MTRRQQRRGIVVLMIAVLAILGALVTNRFGPPAKAAVIKQVDCGSSANKHPSWVYTGGADAGKEVPAAQLPAEPAKSSLVKQACVIDVTVGGGPSHNWDTLFSQVANEPNYWTCFTQVTGFTKAQAEDARAKEAQGWNEQVTLLANNPAPAEFDALFTQYNPGQVVDSDQVNWPVFTNTQGMGGGSCNTFSDTRKMVRLTLTMPGPDKNTAGTPVVFEGCTNPIALKPPTPAAPSVPGTTPVPPGTTPFTPGTSPPGTTPPATSPPTCNNCTPPTSPPTCNNCTPPTSPPTTARPGKGPETQTPTTLGGGGPGAGSSEQHPDPGQASPGGCTGNGGYGGSCGTPPPTTAASPPPTSPASPPQTQPGEQSPPTTAASPSQTTPPPDTTAPPTGNTCPGPNGCG